jgi:hypothetical protein
VASLSVKCAMVRQENITTCDQSRTMRSSFPPPSLCLFVGLHIAHVPKPISYLNVSNVRREKAKSRETRRYWSPLRPESCI